VPPHRDIHSPEIDRLEVAPCRDTGRMPSAPASAFAPPVPGGDLHARGAPEAPDALGAPDASEVPDASDRDRHQADLPILDEVPLLGAAIELARSIDRSVAQLLEALIELQDHDVAEHATGVALEQWLAIAGRRTAADRRMLLTAGDVLRRLPSLRTAFCDEGTVSWAQTRSVVLAVHRLPRALDDLIDGELARTIDACRDSDPDTLIHAVSRAARSWDPAPTRQAQEAAEREEFVALQPRLDGSGGTLFGDLGPLSFATVDAALMPAPRGGDRVAADGEADADGPDDDAAGGATPGDLAADADLPKDRAAGEDDRQDRAPDDPDGAGNGGWLRPGRRRAQRLVELCDASLVVGRADGAGGGRAGSRPQLLVRIDLATLLDRDNMPAELLTTVSGGKLWIDAATARRLVEERGADLRAVVLDDCGRVVGVGRQRRLATDWLADATLAVHDTCSFPGCKVAARRCETDHARPWHATTPDQIPGRTDIDELAPLCRHHNFNKEAEGWRATGSADGSRHWEHPRSGLTTITRPSTWRAAILARASELDRAPPAGVERRSRSLDPDDGESWRREVAREASATYDIQPRAGPSRSPQVMAPSREATRRGAVVSRRN
jgi:hypothetical protein